MYIYINIYIYIYICIYIYIYIWSWVQIPPGQLSIATSENPSVVNTTCISSFHYKRDYLCEISFKANVATDEGSSRNET